MPSTGGSHPIAAFVDAVRADPRCVGLIQTGSLGRGAGDAYSDLDFALVCDGSPEEARARALALCAALGAPRFTYWRGDLLTAFVGPAWQRLDLHAVARAEIAPSPAYAGMRVLADRDGALADVVARSRSQARAKPATSEAELALSCAIDSQIYVALHAARGALWSAVGELAFRQGELYRLLAELRGSAPTHGLRDIERVLDPDEARAFASAWPREASREEVRRAARALWAFTKLVRAEVRARLGAEAVPDVAEDELLAAVDAIRS